MSFHNATSHNRLHFMNHSPGSRGNGLSEREWPPPTLLMDRKIHFKNIYLREYILVMKNIIKSPNCVGEYRPCCIVAVGSSTQH